MFTLKNTLVATAVSSALLSANAIAETPETSDNQNDLEVIVVSGSKTEKALKDVAGSISVVTAEDMEKQVVTEMRDLFKYDPSVQVSGTTGGAQNFIVRGMGGDRVLMIKDGMRMNEGYGANGLNDFVGRGFIETDTLKQVEVAKGAASSLYGSDALGGIIVFTTKDASDYVADGENIGGQVKIGYSDRGEQSNISGSIGLVAGDFEHLIHSSYRDGKESQNFDETKPSLDIDSNSFMYKGKYNINNDDFISFTADLWNQDVEGDAANSLLAHFRTLKGYDVVTENSSSEQENSSYQLRYYSGSGSSFYDTLSVSVYSNDTKQTDKEYAQLDIDAFFGYPIVEIRDMYKTSVYEQKTVGLISHASIELNNIHTLGYGIDLERSESRRNEFKTYEVEGTPKPGYPENVDKFPETEVTRSGIFINDEITLMDGQLTVTPGARFDTYKMDPQGALKEDGEAYKKFDENNLSVNLGTLYRLSDSISVFAQYGQGFKVPAYDLAYIAHDNSLYGYKVVPSDDLSPEKSDTYELGLRGYVNNFYFSGAIFYSKYDDFLSTETVGTEEYINPFTGQKTIVQVSQYRNIDAVTIKGAEFSIELSLSDELAFFANAAYQDGTDDTTGEYITSISPLSGTTGLRFDTENLSTQLVLNWADRMTKVNEGSPEIAGYGTLDLLATYNFNDDMRINFSATNLLDKEYVRYINGRGHSESTDLSYYTDPGRSISATFQYMF